MTCELMFVMHPLVQKPFGERTHHGIAGIAEVTLAHVETFIVSQLGNWMAKCPLARNAAGTPMPIGLVSMHPWRVIDVRRWLRSGTVRISFVDAFM